MGSAKVDKSYYDFLWQQIGGKEHPYDAERIKIILSIIPGDVNTILDVGCGDGAISNALAERYAVNGVDFCQTALDKLSDKVQPILASAKHLPFYDNRFDLVLSSELLEHLPNEVFTRAVSEIKRVSRKYILVTVPNNEKLRQRFTKCSNCGFEFHIYQHLRSFKFFELSRNFAGYTHIYSTLCGALEKPTFDSLSYLMNKLAKAYFFVDTIEIPCPRCGKVAPRFRTNLIHRAIGFSLFLLQNFLNLLLNRKPEPDWLVVLFEKEG